MLKLQIFPIVRGSFFAGILLGAVFTAPTLSLAQSSVPGSVQEKMMPSNSELDMPIISAASPDAETSQAGLNDITHPPLRLTPDKSTIIDLGTAAGSIIVGNPAHLNILADNAKRLIIVPRAQGASFFTVLDKNGSVLMQRHVIVGSAGGGDNKYVRVRRTCAGGADNCQQTSVYFCPDMCHEISIEQMGNSKGGSVPDEGGRELQLNVSERLNNGDDSSQTTNSQLPPPPPSPETLSNE